MVVGEVLLPVSGGGGGGGGRSRRVEKLSIFDLDYVPRYTRINKSLKKNWDKEQKNDWKRLNEKQGNRRNEKRWWWDEEKEEEEEDLVKTIENKMMMKKEE